MFYQGLKAPAVLLLTTFGVLWTAYGAAAEDQAWQIAKSSGEVWVTASGAEQALLTEQTVLKAGDNVRTGRNGRVLLVRGEESILVSPNSIVGVPAEQKAEIQTTIIQQAGSVLIEVEKQDVQHFEVETPYLAAVVKGTHFRVSVSQYGANVDVLRGKVEVTDFKSGQHALVLPGQSGKVSTLGRGGLFLTGSNKLSPIEKGTPRSSPVAPVLVPKAGLSAPTGLPAGQQVFALGALKNAHGAAPAAGNASPISVGGTDGTLRITAAMGEVNLNFQAITSGLAGTTSAAIGSGTGGKSIWSSGGSTPNNGGGQASSQGSSNSNQSNSTANQGNSNSNTEGGNTGAHSGGIAGFTGIANGNTSAIGSIVTIGSLNVNTFGPEQGNGNGRGNGNNYGNGNGRGRGR